MKEIVDQFLPSFVTEYIYLPYLIVVWLIVEWLRYQFYSIDKKIKPKHLTLIVGSIVGVMCYFGESLFGHTVPIKTLLLTYFITTMFYEYAIKPIKEKWFPNFNNKQKE